MDNLKGFRDTNILVNNRVKYLLYFGEIRVHFKAM